MKLKRDIPVYVLSASLLISSLVFAGSRNPQTTSASNNSDLLTKEQFVSDLKPLTLEVINLYNEVKRLKNCVTDMSIALNDPNRSMNVPVC